MSQQSVDKIIGRLDDAVYISTTNSLVLENSVSFTNEDLPYTDAKYNDTSYRDITTQENLSELQALLDSNSPKILDCLKDLAGRKLPGMQFVSYEKLNDSVIIQCTPESAPVRILTVEKVNDKILIPLTVLGRYVAWFFSQDFNVLWQKF